jgi:hypothetical protein
VADLANTMLIISCSSFTALRRLKVIAIISISHLGSADEGKDDNNLRKRKSKKKSEFAEKIVYKNSLDKKLCLH